ncbi:hypothetical protein BKA61DRAFT_665703 [Leptodontidium sp. MPI-SDFR-AT-0119]|nr:hypothetical protein BKA61DRAFT_665703 [Leptodontidium sp. MPI-SDFR-AT-0119]
MSLIRLLQRKPNGEIVFHEPTSGNVPAYAILSHTWGKEEVVYQDIQVGVDMSKTVNKAGWRKIQFCGKQAAVDGLEYFWVDTCCIDKKNAVELGTAINSMFRWYQNATRCYVYLSDVSKPDTRVDDQRAWEEAFRNSRWFTRGWTLQELIAPRLVDFFSSEGGRLGSKLSLESQIYEVTGIANKALRGDALSNFSIKERRSWAERRNTTIEEDAAYCLIGIFDVSMVLNYGERRDQAFRRLEDEIHRLYMGVDFEQFAVELNLASFPEATQFVAREKELSKIHELLQDHSSRSCVILHGLGGMGKTQLAITYARRHKEKYTAIFWLNANDEDSLKLSFRDVVQQVLRYHPSTSVLSSVDQDKDLDQVVSAVKAWLEFPRNSNWLLIYDNFDNPKTSGNPDSSAVDIRQFLPRSDHGSVIITTRSSQVRQGERIHIQKLSDVREGLEIVSNISGRKGIEKDPNAIALVKELDGLPLALSTAGAYLEHLKLQTTSPLLDSYEDRKLHTTWQITFDRIQQQNPASAKLLKLWAYFDRQDLWFDLFRHANSVDDEWIQKLTKDELNFNEAITLLCTFGLVDPDRSPQQQVGARGYMDDKLDIKGLDWAFHNLGDLFTNQGKLAEAEKMYVRALQGCEEVLGPDHTSTLDTVNNLGLLYVDQGKLAEAEKMYLRALQGKEEVLGPDHTSTLFTVNNLGLLYVDQGKLAEAEMMYVRALQGKEEALGPDHTSTLNTIHNLGNLYRDQGKLAKAEKMYVRALQGYKKALGPDHISTLDTVHSLGILYANQGKLAEAEKMYVRALQGKEEALGPDHTSTLDTVHNLGTLYSDQGKLAEAEAMYLRALRGCEKALGPDHTSTLLTVNNLGTLYKDQGKLAEAEKMYLRALQGKEEALGPDHTSTLDTVHNLGTLYSDQGKLAEAEAMYLRALRGCEKALGPDHTSTLLTVNNLGLLYVDQGKLVEAEKMYVRALQGYKEALGPDHTSTLNTVHNLGELYSNQGKLVEAEAMFTRALQGFEEALGPNHTSTFYTVCHLGNLYRLQHQLAKAEIMIRRAMKGFEDTFGPKHTSTLLTIYNLGMLYADQGKLAKAEAMYERALQGYEDAVSLELALSYLPALNTVFAFGDLYSQTDRINMARAMYNRALSGYATVQGPSSKRCKQLEDRLQALQAASAESKVGQDEFTKSGAAKSRSFKQKLRQLGSRLNIR